MSRPITCEHKSDIRPGFGRCRKTAVTVVWIDAGAFGGFHVMSCADHVTSFGPYWPADQPTVRPIHE